MTRFIVFAARINKDNGTDSQCFLGMPLTDKMGIQSKGKTATLPVLAPSVIIAGFPPNDRQYGTRKKL
ncbi:hypothetical protein SAMN05216404_107126 [Nitrosospira multiformis]|uniref:Uncharacterized protein n=1 Tax=Nitrosospira multiformis TaxID=1231 RepID=A0A1H8JN57_9PROT|nr:hypothetical protein SAMN05216404_107126 [Nitrosospira multiformis]